MSKKDYEAITTALAKQVYKDKLCAEGLGTGVDLVELIEEIENHFARTCSTFSRDKFESAVYAPIADCCGLQREI